MKSTFFLSCILLAASSIAPVGRVCYDCKGEMVQSCADACFSTSIRGGYYTGLSTYKGIAAAAAHEKLDKPDPTIGEMRHDPDGEKKPIKLELKLELSKRGRNRRV